MTREDNEVETDGWKMVSPDSNYLGLSYGEWAKNWMNWLVQKDPNTHNNGPVVYLRGVDFDQHGRSIQIL